MFTGGKNVVRALAANVGYLWPNTDRHTPKASRLQSAGTQLAKGFPTKLMVMIGSDNNPSQKSSTTTGVVFQQTTAPALIFTTGRESRKRHGVLSTGAWVLQGLPW